VKDGPPLLGGLSKKESFRESSMSSHQSLDLDSLRTNCSLISKISRSITRCRAGREDTSERARPGGPQPQSGSGELDAQRPAAWAETSPGATLGRTDMDKSVLVFEQSARGVPARPESRARNGAKIHQGAASIRASVRWRRTS
jgi:hypothetical protein